MSDGFVQVQGARLYYETFGEGDPVVFVHAGIANRIMWDPQLPAVADRLAVRFDLRGFGRTEAESVPFSCSADLASVMDQVGIDRAHLVGCSMGGSAVVDFVLSEPDRATSMTLVDSGVGGFQLSEETRYLGVMNEAWERAEETGDYEQLCELELDMWLVGPFRNRSDLDPGLYDSVKQMLLPTYANSVEDHEEAPEGPQAIERLEEISAPTMIVVGSLDVPDMVRIGEELNSRVPDSRLKIIDGAAHLPNLEKPDEFNALLVDFLNIVW